MCDWVGLGAMQSMIVGVDSTYKVGPWGVWATSQASPTFHDDAAFVGRKLVFLTST
jgi:hypothetical protein